MRQLTAILLLIFPWHKVYCQTTDVAGSNELQKWIESDKETNRAKMGEDILIVIVNVKGELKNEFDVWVKDVFYDALYKTKSEIQKAQLKTVRWFEPVWPNKDGTWTYSWIMDPIIPKTDYQIDTFLKKEYGIELGQKHWDKYLKYMASEPKVIVLRQTNY